MSYIDLLQELGRARRALEDLTAGAPGARTKDLLMKRDAITASMNRVTDERVRLDRLDLMSPVSSLDDVATKLGTLATTTKDVPGALALADQATTLVGQVLSTAPGARTLLAAAPGDDQRFTAFCNTHNYELAPTKVMLDRALQIEADHLALAGNAQHDIDIILVR